MKIEEITEEEWKKLDKNSENYYTNGCLFEEKTDNIVAFAWYQEKSIEPNNYYRIKKD